MIIDMHAHVVPKHFPPAGARASAEKWPFMDHFEAEHAKVMIGGENFRTVASGNWDPSARLKDMEQHGVTAQAISPMPELLSYWFSPGDGLEFSRYVNDFITGMCATAPDHFFGLGMVPLQDPVLATKELANLRALGLAGIELGSNVLGQYLGAPQFEDFFVELERQGLCVFVHSLHPTMVQHLASPALTNAVGFPMDTCLTLASFIGGGTAEKVPNLRIAWSHGGGVFPFLLGRYNNQWTGTWNGEAPTSDRGAAMRERMPHSPVEVSRRFFYDTLLFDGRAIRYLIDMIGSSQIIVGTDYPYLPTEEPADKTLRSLGYSEEIHGAITWTNCFRFLGVDPPKFG